MLKTDLHTHSLASPDGGLTLGQYQRILERGVLDCIAITDHNTITFAQHAQASLGDRIIVGEEIMTSEGEIIGLFLSDCIQPRQSLEETIAAIRAQGGVVYVPHPFETRRKGLSYDALQRIRNEVDIVEVYNGRAMQKSCQAQALVWAKHNDVVGVASSDAHGLRGWGRTYTEITQPLKPGMIHQQFHNARLIQKDVGIIGRMYPAVHRTKRKLYRHA